MSSPALATSPSSPAAVAFPAIIAARPIDRRVLAARAGRIAFGVALVGGAVVLAVDALAGFHHHGGARLDLGATWVAAIAAGLCVAAAVRAQMALADPGRAHDRFLAASLMWPLAGIALILPLTIHLPFFLGDVSSGFGRSDSFNSWVGASLLIVGHAHLALAFLSARRAQQLVDNEHAQSPARIFGIVVLVSAIPGVLLFLLPPLLTAFTGLPFLLLLQLPDRIIAKERAALLQTA